MPKYLLLIALCAPLWAQPVFTDIFPQDEFAARRARVMEKIGDGVAILLGTTEPPGEVAFRQANQFYYVCGVAEPRAILVIDAKAKTTTLFLNPRIAKREDSMFGPGLSPGDDAAIATGIGAVLPRSDFKAMLDGFAAAGRTIYTPFRAEVLGSISSGDPDRLWAANKNDPWDGRTSREQAFQWRLKEAAPKSEIKDLDPILDQLRGIKDAREIALMREATRIAGLGLMEAMRDAKPGLREYELQADSEFVFKKYGSFGAAYFALIGAGKNTYYTHYNKNTAVLEDGDLVQMDYAPDYKYYQSDVTRVFPANGRFTPWQKEYYTVYLSLYQAVMTSIKPHVTAAAVIKDAVVKMDAIMTSYKFTDDKIKTAAAAFVQQYRKQQDNPTASLGHTVGMEVHDRPMPTPTLEPGEIFTIEPEMRIDSLHLGLRLEDMLLITATGYENMSAFVPVDIAGIEKLMADHKHGLSAAHSTLPTPMIHE
jgi:Xaa-Pro aminopeptidase